MLRWYYWSGHGMIYKGAISSPYDINKCHFLYNHNDEFYVISTCGKNSLDGLKLFTINDLIIFKDVKSLKVHPSIHPSPISFKEGLKLLTLWCLANVA